MRQGFALLLTFAATLQLGCTVGQRPEFTVVDAQIAQRTEQGALLRLRVEGANRNDYPLELRDADYTVELNGREVFTARRWPQATLPALGTQTFELPVPIPRDAGSISQLDEATYRLDAAFTHIGPSALARTLFDAGLRRPKTRFVQTGQLDVQPAEPPAADAENHAENPS